jgi:hypothetical protein
VECHAGIQVLCVSSVVTIVLAEDDVDVVSHFP